MSLSFFLLLNLLFSPYKSHFIKRLAWTTFGLDWRWRLGDMTPRCRRRIGSSTSGFRMEGDHRRNERKEDRKLKNRCRPDIVPYSHAKHLYSTMGRPKSKPPRTWLCGPWGAAGKKADDGRVVVSAGVPVAAARVSIQEAGHVVAIRALPVVASVYAGVPIQHQLPAWRRHPPCEC